MKSGVRRGDPPADGRRINGFPLEKGRNVKYNVC